LEDRCILQKREGAVGTLVLNRPRALNALNEEMLAELLARVREEAENPETRALILTGTGRAFCFGADLAAFSPPQDPSSKNPVLDLLAKAQEIIRLLAAMPKPTIAVLNGFATGLGLDIALACDLRIAAERAKLGEAFVNLGLVPDGGGSYHLPRLIGYARAAEMIFTGEPISSEDALRIGLINRRVPLEELGEAARKWAEKLARAPSLAVALAKRNLRENLTGDLDAALQREAERQKICLESADHREAVAAFREKRDPVFRGK
jgi:2-(1,2-epoxy-1,2-dihydrophenyl)acetyl-CoA isomerase